jgi:hypothetical protein
MRKVSLFAAILLAFTSGARAQVTVSVDLGQDQYLVGEPIQVAVRIINRSGQALDLGSEADWLTFSLESGDGNIVRQLQEVPVQGEFKLESAQRATKRVDIAPYFVLDHVDRYKMTALVKIRQWGQELRSNPVSFDLIQGTKIWEQEFGVPHASATNTAPPEVRKYILQEARYLRSGLRLYLKVTDASGTFVFKVSTVGPMLSFGGEEARLDKFSRLHVLYQNGPHSFSYSVFDPDGNLLTRQTYDYTSRPELTEDRNGNTVVSGGVRDPRPDDFPVATTSKSDTPAPQP